MIDETWLEHALHKWQERALSAEMTVREQDVTIGELLNQIEALERAK